MYVLAQKLATEEVYAWSELPLVSLFQKLFITQAALCVLTDEYEQSNRLLVVTPVEVYLKGEPISENLSYASAVITDIPQTPNFEFFSNFDNFHNVSEADVQSLLESFWRRYDAEKELDPACQVLGVTSESPWSDVQSRYRVLASEHHPDRGGDAARFIEIRRAYETLRAHYC